MVGEKPLPASIATDCVAITFSVKRALLSIRTSAFSVPCTAFTACWIVAWFVGTIAVAASATLGNMMAMTATAQRRRHPDPERFDIMRPPVRARRVSDDRHFDGTLRLVRRRLERFGDPLERD